MALITSTLNARGCGSGEAEGRKGWEREPEELALKAIGASTDSSAGMGRILQGCACTERKYGFVHKCALNHGFSYWFAPPRAVTVRADGHAS
jgi:hypothetical protein